MGARLMVVHGVMQRDEDIIHVVVRKLEDGTHRLRHLSDGLMPSTLNQGAGGGSWRPPVGRHPRDVSVIPKSRDFH
jgi:error-prone DNA polymerase